jgi:hypothetical protein
MLRLSRRKARVVSQVAVMGVLLLRGVLSTGCSSGCGLGLTQQVVFSDAPAVPSAPPNPLPCCGGFLFRDVSLTDQDIKEVDLANTDMRSGHVDAFLTAPDCTTLFDGPYNGAAAQPLCKIYIGPVVAGSVSARQAIPKGIYRLFAQAYASNETSSPFKLDLGIWGKKCGASSTAPSP